MQYDNIIIDTNDYYHRSFAIKKDEFESSKDLINATIVLTVQQILNIKEKYLKENGIVWVLADNPTSKKVIRKQLDPSYKANRIKESDPFYRGIDFTLLLFSKYSDQFRISRIKTYEADDLTKPLLESFSKNETTLLCSADLDWSRSMSSNVHWLSRKKLYTQESFKDEYKFIPNEQTVTLYKSLLGDDSDNIPAIKGINEQTALNIVHNYKDVFDLLSSLNRDNILSSFAKNTIKENKDRLILNHQLIYFSSISQEEIQQATIKGCFDQKALSILYNTLGFNRGFDSRIKYEETNFNKVFDFDQIKRK